VQESVFDGAERLVSFILNSRKHFIRYRHRWFGDEVLIRFHVCMSMDC